MFSFSFFLLKATAPTTSSNPDVKLTVQVALPLAEIFHFNGVYAFDVFNEGTN